MADDVRKSIREHLWLLGLAAACLIVGYLGLAVGNDWSSLQDALNRNGVSGSAAIIALECSAKPNAGGAAYGGEPDFVPDCHATYQFADRSGVVRQQTKSITEAFHRRLAVGDHIPVTYLPEDPTISRIEASGPASKSMLLQTTGAIIGVFGLLLVFAFWHRVRPI